MEELITVFYTFPSLTCKTSSDVFFMLKKFQGCLLISRFDSCLCGCCEWVLTAAAGSRRFPSWSQTFPACLQRCRDTYGILTPLLLSEHSVLSVAAQACRLLGNKACCCVPAFQDLGLDQGLVLTVLWSLWEPELCMCNVSVSWTSHCLEKLNTNIMMVRWCLNTQTNPAVTAVCWHASDVTSLCLLMSASKQDAGL